MYLRLVTFTKTLPQMSFHLFFCYFFRSGARLVTLLTAGALTDLQLPTTASNVFTTVARLGGVGRVLPQTKILTTPVIRRYVSASNGVRLSIMLLGTSQIFHASHRIRSHCSAGVSCHWAKYLYTKCAEILSLSRFSDHSSYGSHF